MSGFIRAMKFAVAFAAAFILMGASSPSHAQTGTVYLKIIKAGFIVGVGGGHGTLSYEGRRYHLRIGGVGIGTIGIAEARLAGTVYNLRSPADIAGTYGAATASAAIVGGAKVARLQNERGVILELHGVQMGFEVSLGLGGMTIAVR
jgi:hypothetical protein